MKARGSASSRGYGYEHAKLRASCAIAVDAGLASCARCGVRILPGQAWDLGHTEDRAAYTGPEHAACNRAAGARKGNRMRGVARAVFRTSRNWA